MRELSFRNASTAVVAGTLMICSQPASAGVIPIVDGTVYSLQSGTNQFSGSLGIDSTSNDGQNRVFFADTLNFSISSFQEITEASIQIVSFTQNGPTGYSYFPGALFDVTNSSTVSGLPQFNLNTSEIAALPTLDVSPPSPIQGPGQFRPIVGQGAPVGPAFDLYRVDVIYTFTVVPSPAVSAAFGLSALALIRRKR